MPAACSDLCREQQARKDASSYPAWDISCNTWVFPHWLLLATAFWMFTGVSMSPPLVPHTLPMVMWLMSTSDSAVQGWQGWAAPRRKENWVPNKVIRAGPVAVTKISHSPGKAKMMWKVWSEARNLSHCSPRLDTTHTWHSSGKS